MLIAIGKKAENRWHLAFAQRWVVHYNFYVNDAHWGRMFVRICPYFPFSARVCLNQHHWLATRMRAEGISFRQETNAFLTCSDPSRLQILADSLTARDLQRCGDKWLAAFTPFFTAKERREGHCRHRLFFAQVEYCDNLIFHRRAALDSTPEQYPLASLRYDLSKLRAKRLIEKVEHARRYRLLPHGDRICVVFLKLFERVYAPLTAGLLRPIAADARLADDRRQRLDRLYQRIVTDLDALLRAVGLKVAA
jgi:hypothetical protein